MANWIISAFADEYGNSLDEQIKALHRFEIDHIELRFLDGRNVADLTAAESVAVKSKLDGNGIRVSAIGSPLGKINLADDFSSHLEKAARVFENANIFNAKNIRMFSFYLHSGKSRRECRGEVIDKLGQLIELAQRHGVQLCHENEAEIYGEDPEHCLDLMQVFNGRLRCVFDMGNFVLDGCKPWPDGYEMLKNYIEYFHIKDSLPEGAIVPAGCGKAHIREILHTYMNEFKRDVLISLEPHLQTFDGLNKLVGKTFENPYQFATAQEAFAEAVRCTREILRQADALAAADSLISK